MKKTRYWEVDVVRAMALCLMLVQHVYVIKNLVFFNTATASQEAEYVGRVGALLFLLLVGVSGYLSYTRYEQKNRASGYRHFLLRGLFLLACGVVVSCLSFLVLPRSPIYFGVLSFIGASVLLLPFFVKYQLLRLVTIILAPAIGYVFTFIHPSTVLLLPLGMYPVPFHSIDYWPLFPWISVVLAGIIIGESLYAKGVRQIAVADIQHPVIRLLQWIGSHTLVLYLLHLPVLYSIFWVIKTLRI